MPVGVTPTVVEATPTMVDVIETVAAEAGTVVDATETVAAVTEISSETVGFSKKALLGSAMGRASRGVSGLVPVEATPTVVFLLALSFVAI